MKSLKAILGTSCAAWLLVGCTDPSENVPQASASAARQTSTPSEAVGREYVIQPESTIGFVGSKVTGSHEGGFKTFSGTIRVAEGKIVGSPEIKIDMTSTWSDNERLTGHLKSADFFDVEQYPESRFVVTAFDRADAEAKVTGNLTLHGVTKSISFPADLQITDEAVTVRAEFAINRQDFNVSYPGRPDDLIRDGVVIKLDLKATPSAEG